MNNLSAISWREYVTFDDMILMSALYKNNTLSWYKYSDSSKNRYLSG